MRIALKRERIANLSEVDFIVRVLSNAHANGFRCNVFEALGKFFKKRR